MMLLGYILGIIQDTDSLCSNSARTTCYNQEKTSPKGLVFSWLSLQVTNDSSEVNATNETLQNDANNCHEITLNDEEKARLVRYFDVLIEMDRVNIR